MKDENLTPSEMLAGVILLTPKPNPEAQISLDKSPASEAGRSAELAFAELERSRWALERKEWILAQVYANQAIQWIKSAERHAESSKP